MMCASSARHVRFWIVRHNGIMCQDIPSLVYIFIRSSFFYKRTFLATSPGDSVTKIQAWPRYYAFTTVGHPWEKSRSVVETAVCV